MPVKSYIYRYLLILLCCAVFSTAAPKTVFALSPRLETSRELSGDDTGFVIDCPSMFSNSFFKTQWYRAADFAREMGVKKGDRVLVVGWSPMLLSIFLAINGIDCTFVDMDDNAITVVTGFIELYAQTSGDIRITERLHPHLSLFQKFDTDMEFDHVTLFDIFYALRGDAPEQIIQNAVRYTKDSGTLWLGRNYSAAHIGGQFDTEKELLAKVPFGAFLSRAPGHKNLSNPDFPGGYFYDSLNTAYTVRKDDQYHILISA